MLVLSREVLESIIVTIPPSDRERVIKLTVLDLRHTGRTRLGFETDRDIVIDREEVMQSKLTNGTTKPDGACGDGQASDPI